MGYVCASCGKTHDELPMDLGFNAPTHWDFLEVKGEKDYLTGDFCVIHNNESADYFIRGILVIPILDDPKYETFNYGIWVSQSKENFQKYNEIYGTEAELKESPHFGWFSNRLKGYPETLGLKSNAHFQGGKSRPLVVLEHTDHPLSQEQHHGITMARVHELLALNEVKLD